MAPKNSVRVLSICCLVFGILSIPLSLLITYLTTPTIEHKILGIFVGIWAPTLISLATYFKNN